MSEPRDNRLFQPPPRVVPKNYYINLENDKFLLACGKESFKHEYQHHIPPAFLLVNESTYVAQCKRTEPDKIENLQKALRTLVDEEDIRSRLNDYLESKEYRPVMY